MLLRILSNADTAHRRVGKRAKPETVPRYCVRAVQKGFGTTLIIIINGCAYLNQNLKLSNVIVTLSVKNSGSSLHKICYNLWVSWIDKDALCSQGNKSFAKWFRTEELNSIMNPGRIQCCASCRAIILIWQSCIWQCCEESIKGTEEACSFGPYPPRMTGRRVDSPLWRLTTYHIFRCGTVPVTWRHSSNSFDGCRFWNEWWIESPDEKTGHFALEHLP